MGAPAKVQYFYWLCIHNVLLTNEMRFKMGLAANPLYQHCSLECEDIMHCLRDCPHSSEVWIRLGMCNHVAFLTSCNASDWIYNMVHSARLVIFMAGVWWIWRWRNNMVLMMRFGASIVSFIMFMQAMMSLPNGFPPRELFIMLESSWSTGILPL